MVDLAAVRVHGFARNQDAQAEAASVRAAPLAERLEPVGLSLGDAAALGSQPSRPSPPGAPAADDTPPDEDGHKTGDDHPPRFTRRGVKTTGQADHGQQDRIDRH
jgi:hypothetical protein